MKTKSFYRLFCGLFFIMGLLVISGCSGSVEYNVGAGNSTGWPFPKPKFVADKTLTFEVPVSGQLRLMIDGIHGDIEIDGREDINSVSIIARKVIGADNQEVANSHLDDLDILVTDQAEELLIETVRLDFSQGIQYIVHYDVILPSDLEVEVTLINGDITITNLDNRIAVDGQNGNVYLSNIYGEATVNLGNGNIDSTIDLPLDCEIFMSVDNGNIDLNIPTSTSADFSAEVNIGAINTVHLDFEDAIQTSRLLTGTLGLGEGLIDLISGNGRISVVGLN